VRHLRRGDRSHELEPAQIIADAVEQPLTAADERRHEVDFHLIHESGRELLPGGIRSSGERHVFTGGRAPRPIKRRLDAVGHERESRLLYRTDPQVFVSSKEDVHRGEEDTPPTQTASAFKSEHLPTSGVEGDFITAAPINPD